MRNFMYNLDWSNRNQQTLTEWVGLLPDFRELNDRGVREEEILRMAIDGKARLTRNEVKQLCYKSSRTGQFFTPEPVADLVAFFGDIHADESVLDPACGLGDLMFSALNYTEKVEGIELMRETSALASKVLGLNVRNANALEEFPSRKYDVVVANPPFGRVSEGQVDRWSDFELNKGKKSNRLEVLFLELCLRLAKRRVVMIAPNSLLSCNRDRFAREWILENFGYRATIDLPRKTFWKSTRERNKWTTPATTTNTSIMVMDKVKPKGNYKIFMAMPKQLEDFEKLKENWNEFRRNEK